MLSLAGSLTADGAALVPGDVVVPAEWKAKEEAEEEERRRERGGGGYQCGEAVCG